MKKLENILEYQKYDTELKKIIDEINRSEVKREVVKLRKLAGRVNHTASEKEKNAEQMWSRLAKMQEEYEALMQEFESINTQISACGSDEEKIKYCRDIERIRNRLSSIANAYDRGINESREIVKQANETIAQNRIYRAEYTLKSEELNKLQESYNPEIDKIKEKMKEIEPNIDAKLFQEYQTIRKDGIFPIVVPATILEKASTHSCFCGFNLTQGKDDELRSAGMCKCESCQRLLYLNK